MTHALPLQDRIAAKLNVLIEGIADHKMSDYSQEHLAKEIISDLCELILTIREKPQGSQVLEKDVRFDVYAQAVPGGEWGLRLTHIPTGIVIDADSSAHKSQIQARVAVLHELEARLKTKGWTSDDD
ncbi:RF-1 peptide chain release factor [Mycobacterium phage Phabba]|uniref:RF-1 peptide chain release factor n=1 Tax=Mycobacterium phage Phabba TaxID=2027899 RepID=A0A249XS59_9CAUD|nr:RF-1 peptide chain release factor [Mycobacterium phage Phabba]ASZ74577.1 RF-1 peptide chain release factor [Mycobacterium phage Phabba]